LRVTQPELVESPGFFIDECHYAELLGEASELADRRGFLREVDEMSPYAALGEKSKCFPGIGAFLDSEDLDFQNETSR